MPGAGFAPTELAVAGGATNSPLWLQIHADVSGLPLRLTRVPDAPALGCAILAAVASGAFPDVAAAVKAMVHTDRVVLPRPGERSLSLIYFKYRARVQPGEPREGDDYTLRVLARARWSVVTHSCAPALGACSPRAM